MTTAWSRVRTSGPLAPYAQPFARWLLAKGYTELSVTEQLRLMAHLSRWMDGHGLVDAVVLDDPKIQKYCDARRARGYTARLTPGGLRPIQDFLTEEGLPTPPVVEAPAGPGTELLGRYESHLAGERGLVAPVVQRWVAVAAMVIAEHPGLGGGDGTVGAPEVIAFCARELSRRGHSAANDFASALRSFLRFLHVNGLVAGPLAQAVPPVANRRGVTLPRGLAPGTVERLVASCDRRRGRGRRDRAILLLLTRLGLRAGEVARLGLEDIDWRVGEIVIHGKGRRDDRLPLPRDVGEAVVDYLRRGRPKTTRRTVFLRAIAPVGPLSPARVTGIVHDACGRAGLPKVGAHRLRHALATQMLASGASLPEIGQVLRHARIATTSIYAKVDVARLADLVVPWPGRRS